MKKSSDRIPRPEPRLAPVHLGLEREPSAVREPVPDYFTLFLLQELLASIGLRHKH
jgi:hypothetical protein